MRDIVVAIDLGTSGSAWTHSVKGLGRSRVEIRVPKGKNNKQGMKTETAVLLKTGSLEVLAFGQHARELLIEELQEAEESVDWDSYVAPRPVVANPGFMSRGFGGEFEGHMEAARTSSATSMLFRWFMMELCKNRGYKTWEDPIATADGGQTVPLLHVMAAVLRHFKDDALEFFNKNIETDVDVDGIQWVITIPAIYDDFAKRFMRVAAHEAGITDAIDSPGLQLCLEPEAAFLATTMMDAPDLYQAGTKTMILDCGCWITPGTCSIGGGTVDITTHEIISLDPLRLKELLPPTSGPWGSTYVDSEFMAWFGKFIGDDNYTKVRRTSAFYDILAEWWDYKLGFKGREDIGFCLNMSEFNEPLGLTADSMKDLRRAHNDLRSEDSSLHVTGIKFKVVLPAPLVLSFFASTVDEISKCLVGLKQDESLSGLNYVILVGGFAASPIVQAAVRTSCENDGCRVIVPIRPDTAINVGAILFAEQKNLPISRREGESSPPLQVLGTSREFRGECTTRALNIADRFKKCVCPDTWPVLLVVKNK